MAILLTIRAVGEIKKFAIIPISKFLSASNKEYEMIEINFLVLVICNSFLCT